MKMEHILLAGIAFLLYQQAQKPQTPIVVHAGGNSGGNAGGNTGGASGGDVLDTVLDWGKRIVGWFSSYNDTPEYGK